MSAPLDLTTAEAALFRPHVGSTFLAQLEGTEHPLTLQEVKDLPAHEKREIPPFSLAFECAAAVLPAATYSISHPELAPLQLFLSPFEGGADWCKLEAIFN